MRPLVAALALLLVAACGSDDDPASDAGTAPESSESAEQLAGPVVVLAAASLTETFTELAEQFEQQHPEVTVQLSFGGSSALAQQIVSGAPADVFAAASPVTMGTVVDAELATGEPEVFVSNTLVIAVPTGNPAGVTTLEQFADESLLLALCAPEVPCGAAAQKVFEVAGVTPGPDTLEQDVKAVTTKISLGEIDAGLIYRTDAQAAADTVEALDFPESSEAVNDYPIVALADAPNPMAAAAFVEFIGGAEAATMLEAAGFQLP